MIIYIKINFYFIFFQVLENSPPPIFKSNDRDFSKGDIENWNFVK